MRTLAFLVVLAAGALAAPDTVEKTADRFLDAFKSAKGPLAAQIALRPPGEVPYALVIERLLEKDELDAAQKVADLREDAPDGTGLRVLVSAARGGVRPEKELWMKLQAAERFIKRGRPDQALAVMDREDWPRDTVIAVRVAALRAEADVVGDRLDLAREGWDDAADLAQRIGWFAFELDMRRRQLTVAQKMGDGKTANRALGECIRLARLLDRDDLAIHLLTSRAKLLAKRGYYDEARADIDSALEIARGDDRRKLQEAQLLALMGTYFVDGGMPRAGLRVLREAIAEFDKIGGKALEQIPTARYNVVRALTDLARYKEALAMIDRVELATVPPVFRAGILAQRAHILRRRGSLQKAVPAYEQAVTAATTPADGLALLVALAELHLARWDRAAAEKVLTHVLAQDAKHLEANAARAVVRGMRGRDVFARDDFKRTRGYYKAGRDPIGEGRLLLRHAAFERTAGDIDAALSLAAEARGLFFDNKSYAHIISADAWLADLFLLKNQQEKAEQLLERVARSMRLVGTDMGRGAGLAHLRRGLLMRLRALRTRNRGFLEEADKDFRFALKAAAAVNDKGLEAQALSALALLNVELKPDASPQDDNRKAIAIAEKADDQRAVAVLYTNQAMLDPATAVESAQKAIAALDMLGRSGVDSNSLIEGDNPWLAPSIGIRALLADAKMAETDKAALALEWMERNRAARLQVALRGREAILAAVLDKKEHERYRTVRDLLLQARAEKAGVKEAEAALDAFADDLRKTRPWAVGLAFPRPVQLADLQRALRDDEVLVRFQHDNYARAVLAATSKKAILRPLDLTRPLDAVAELLKGKKRLIVVPDGLLATRPLETAPFGKGHVIDKFEVFYLPSAAALGRARRAGAAPRNPIEWSCVLDFGKPGLTGIQIRRDRLMPSYWFLMRRLQGDTFAFTETRIVRPDAAMGEPVRPAGLFALVEAIGHGGPLQGAVSLLDETPLDLWKRALQLNAEGASFSQALLQAKREAKKRGGPAATWGGPVLYGLPD
jgi:tetratricopeptide (TPR) repeat protein